MTTTSFNLATYTSQRYLIAHERAERLVEKYISYAEKADGQRIDRAAIEMDDEQFLCEMVDAAATTGDLYI